MKNLTIYFVLIYFLIISNCYTQSGWVWQNPIPSAENIVDVKFVNSQTGYAIGYSGNFQKTTNAGLNWFLISPGDNISGIMIFSFDENNLIIACDSGRILKTTDGGASWILKSIGYNVSVRSLYFTDVNTGYATTGDYWPNINGKVLKTFNGGDNWSIVLNTAYNLNYIEFVNPSTGFVSSSFGDTGYVYRTTDGGINWTQTPTPGLRKFYFVNQNTGYLIGSYAHGLLWKTTNRGLNWSFIYYNGSHIVNIKFLTPDTGFFITSYGGLFKTYNGGYDWIQIGYIMNQYHTAFDTYDGVLMLGGGEGGDIRRSTNGGYNWTSRIQGFTSDFEAVQFVNENTGYIAGHYNTVLKTTNSGINWFAVLNPDTIPFPQYYAMNFVNKNTGYIAGEMGIVQKTTNAGLNWILQIPYYTSNHIYDIRFINADTGFLVGRYGIYKYTTSGGANWMSRNIGSNNHLHTIFFVDDYIGYIAGSDSFFYKTTNTGENWIQLQKPISCDVLRLSFVNTNTGFACGHINGDTGVVLKTSNGGLNWTVKKIPGMVWPVAMQFLNESVGYIYSINSGKLYKTIDSGNTWRSSGRFSNIYYWNFYFVNENTGYIVGIYGAIRKTTNGGNVFIRKISERLPENYALSQNHPNPFNSTTNIRYELKSTSDVRLIIYDILGRRVVSLVNERQTAGKYEVSFDAYSLPSGVYFYKLVTDSFVDVKKMVLVK